jgi:ATP-dependent RNA helicase DDX21
MMASDIISPSSYMDPVEPEVEKKPEEHLTYFIKNPAMIDLLQKKGIKFFFPIQYMTFETIYNVQDLIGRDRTGSGKTMAYSLPVIERFREQGLFKNPYIKYLIVLPTR